MHKTWLACLILMMSGCATVNYTHGGKPCDTILEDDSDVVLKCSKTMPRGHEPRERR